MPKPFKTYISGVILADYLEMYPFWFMDCKNYYFNHLLKTFALFFMFIKALKSDNCIKEILLHHYNHQLCDNMNIHHLPSILQKNIIEK